MRVLKRNPWLAGLGALLAMIVLSARVATADTSTDRGGSIIAFPKVIADGTRDTLIQISNLNNGLVFAHCVYMDASPENPALPVNPITNPRRCVEHDFLIRLTRQQPTIWRVSTGRVMNALDTVGACELVDDDLRQTCPGFDPGNIPNQFVDPSAPFEGHLICVQVDASGAPTGGDALKGEAFIESVGVGDVAPGADGLVSAYNAISISGGTEGPDTDSILNLNGAEYSACPGALRFTHLAEGVEDPVVGEAFVTTDLTLMPCTIDYESQKPTEITLQFLVFDEFESANSFNDNLTCWFDSFLSDINGGTPWNPSNSTVYMTQVRPQEGSRCRGGTFESEFTDCTTDDDCPGGGICAPASGVLGVAESFRVGIDDALTGSSAINLHQIGTRENDQIFLQATIEGVCEGGSNEGFPCTGDMECPGGVCEQD